MKLALEQNKSGKLLDDLTPSLTQGENLLSEFDVKRIIRDAKNVPERYQGLSIEGLARLVNGEVNEGCELCERAILLAPANPVSLSNYSLALRNLGMHVKHYEILLRCVNSIVPEILSDIAISAAYWSDVDVLRKVMPKLNSMEIEKSSELERAEAAYRSLCSHVDDADDLKLIGQIMRETADKHRLRLGGSRAHYILDDLKTVIVSVKTDDANLLSSLNDEIVTEILTKGLESSLCIGYFEAFVEEDD